MRNQNNDYRIPSEREPCYQAEIRQQARIISSKRTLPVFTPKHFRRLPGKRRVERHPGLIILLRRMKKRWTIPDNQREKILKNFYRTQRVQDCTFSQSMRCWLHLSFFPFFDTFWSHPSHFISRIFARLMWINLPFLSLKYSFRRRNRPYISAKVYWGKRGTLTNPLFG